MTSRYALFHGPGQSLQVEQAGVPELAPGEVLVSIDLCTLCGSDVHTYQGNRQVPCPTVLGHEMVGRLVAVGGDEPLLDVSGKPLEMGDRVTWSVTANCGDCYFCQHDLPQKCNSLYKYGHQRHDPNRPLAGGLADYCQLVPGSNLVKVPDSVSDAAAAPASCATATVVGACRRIGLESVNSLLILGAGMLGLTAAGYARAAGVEHIIVVDMKPERLELASRFGATATVVASDESTLEREVATASDGRGVDAVLELSGSTQACKSGLQQLRIGGRMMLVGAVFSVDALPLDPEFVVRRCLRIEGVHNYAPADLQVAMDFLADGGCQQLLAELVDRQFPLLDVQQAFEWAATQECYRVGVQMSPRDADV